MIFKQCLKAKSSQYENVCYFASTYSLLLYLCYTSEEEYNNTFFVFSETFPKDIAKNFTSCCFIPKYKESKYFFVLKKWVISKLYKWLFIPRINKNTRIFCQDHTAMLQLLIGQHPYTLVAESPSMVGILLSHVPIEQKKLIWKHRISEIVNRTLLGPIYGHSLGHNALCFSALVTDDESIKYLKGKTVTVLNIFDAWSKKTQANKNIVLRLYGICSSDLQLLKSKRIIVFTQPFMPYLTIDENKEYMVALINKYSHKDMVIKVHPRDEIDYESLFPDVMICRLRVPSQLFDMLGVRFEIAATYFSAAVLDFSYDIRIDWYADELMQKLKFLSNSSLPPRNVNKCKL